MSPSTAPRARPIVSRTDAGWMLPALFGVLGLVPAIGGVWMFARGGIGTGATVGVFGVCFLFLALRMALETLRVRIELHDDHVLYVSPWRSRSVDWESLEELSIEEVRTIQGGKERIHRWYSLRPRARRALFFSSSWKNSAAVAQAVEARGVPVDVALFTIDRDAE